LQGKAFTEEEDRFIVCMTHQLGYGRWEELKYEIRRSWNFRFDWFIKVSWTEPESEIILLPSTLCVFAVVHSFYLLQFLQKSEEVYPEKIFS
jgi:hypothetical protein